MVYEGGWIGLRHRCSELAQLLPAVVRRMIMEWVMMMHYEGSQE